MENKKIVRAEELANLRKIKNLICEMTRRVKKSKTISRDLIKGQLRLKEKYEAKRLKAIEENDKELVNWYDRIIVKTDILINEIKEKRQN